MNSTADAGGNEIIQVSLCFYIHFHQFHMDNLRCPDRYSGIDNTEHDESFPHADQCLSIKIRFLQLIAILIKKIIADPTGSILLNIDQHWRLIHDSTVGDYRKAFKNNFSLREGANTLIFWIFFGMVSIKGKLVSKLKIIPKILFLGYFLHAPPKF